MASPLRVQKSALIKWFSVLEGFYVFQRPQDIFVDTAFQIFKYDNELLYRLPSVSSLNYQKNDSKHNHLRSHSYLLLYNSPNKNCSQHKPLKHNLLSTNIPLTQ
jgi:hypothetical protein